MVRRDEGIEPRRRRNMPLRTLALAFGSFAPFVFDLDGVATARADSVPVLEALTVEGSVCIGRDDLARELAERLGRDRVDNDIRVVVRGSPNGASFSILRNGQSLGERRLEAGTNCAKLRSALAVAIAVAMDAAVNEEKKPPALTPGVDPAARGPEVGPLAQTKAVIESHHPRSLSIGGFGAVLIDVLPVVVVGGGVSFGYAPLPPLRLRASFIATDSGTVALGSAGLHASLLAGRVDGCAVFGQARMAPHLCLGVAGGAARADGFGLATDYSIERPWVAGLLRGDLQVRVIAGLTVDVGVDAVLPFVAPLYEIALPSGSTETQDRTPFLGFAADLGVAYDFL
jgi:hypothetical protein